MAFVKRLKKQTGLEKAQPAAIASLTDNTGETADSTIAICDTVVTGVDGTGSNAASKADVDSRLDTINKNFADLAAKLNAVIAAQRSRGVIDT